jgi:Helicase associated domain
LGIWVGTQRIQQKKGALSADRKIRLDEIGFIWDALDSAWETKFAELKRYRDEHGDCNVPAVWRENPQLGSWVHTQRTVNKAGRLSTARKAHLDALGFVWSVRVPKYVP